MFVTEADPPPMSPGTYLQKRRQVAGLTIEAAAAALAEPRHSAEQIASRLRLVEAGETATMAAVVHMDLIDRLPSAFRFDKHVYYALVGAAQNPKAPVPPVCRRCACSFWDACVDGGGDPCGWANAGSAEPPLCTMCIGLDPDPGEPEDAPIAANEAEIRHAA